MSSFSIHAFVKKNRDEISKEFNRLSRFELTLAALKLKNEVEASRYGAGERIWEPDSDDESDSKHMPTYTSPEDIYALMQKIIKEKIITRKKAEEVRPNYNELKKKLSKELQNFLTEYFPNITNIHEVVNERTPFSLALENEDWDLVKEILLFDKMVYFLKEDQALEESILYRKFLTRTMHTDIEKDIFEKLKRSDSYEAKEFLLLQHFLLGFPKIKKEAEATKGESKNKSLLQAEDKISNMVDLIYYLQLEIKKEENKTAKDFKKQQLCKYVERLFKVVPQSLHKILREKLEVANIFKTAMKQNNVPLIIFLSYKYDFLPDEIFTKAIKSKNNQLLEALIKRGSQDGLLREMRETPPDLGKLDLVINSLNAKSYRDWFDFIERVKKIKLDEQHQTKLIKIIENKMENFLLEKLNKLNQGAVARMEAHAKEFDAKTFRMDDHLFAHVNNDHVLAGTHLQGSQLSHTLGYLNYFIEEVLQGRFSIPGASLEFMKNYVENLKKIKEKVSDALEINSLITTSKADLESQSLFGEEKDKLAAAYANHVEERIFKRLKEKGEVLITGGWAGKPGHAMLYEIKKVSGKFVLIIHNTGDGLETHARRDSAKMPLYSSVRVFEIPVKSEEHLIKEYKGLIARLITPKIKEKFSGSYTGQEFYDQVLIKEISQYGLREVDPVPYTREWTPGQRSGTCTWQVIGSALKSFPFTGGIDYRDFRYEIRLHSLKKYFEDNQKRLNEGTVQRQLNFALQEFSRITKHLSNISPPVLSSERVEESIKLIKHIKKALEEKIVTPLQSDKELPQYIANSRLMHLRKQDLKRTIERGVTQFQIPSIKTELYKEEKAVSETSPSLERVQFNSKDPKSSMDALLAVCRSHFKLQHNATVAQLIEDFYAQLPLNPSYWQNFSKAELNDCMEKLGNIAGLYGQAVSQESLVPFARRTVAYLTNQAVSAQLASSYFGKEDRNVFLQAFDGLNLKDVEDFLNSPWFITLNDQDGKRLKEVQNYLQSVGKAKAGLERKNYLEELIAGNPRLKAAVVKAMTEVLRRTEDDPLKTRINELRKKNVPMDMIIIDYFSRNYEQFKKEFPEMEVFLKVIANVNLRTAETNSVFKGRMDAFLSGNDTAVARALQLGFSQLKETKDNKFVLTNIDWDDFYSSAQLHTIQETQPRFNDSYKAIFDLKLNSNQVQTGLNGDKVTETHGLYRALLNLHVDERTQIATTLDFMKREFFRLEEPQNQNYIFMCLFKRGLLEKQLRESPTTLSTLIDIIERGLNTYSEKGKIKPPIFFFLKVMVSLEGVLESLANSPNPPNLAEAKKELLQLGERLKKMESSNDRISRNCHLNNVIHLSYKLTFWEPKPEEADVKSLLNSLLFRKSTPSADDEDPFLTDLENKKYSDVVHVLKKYFEDLGRENPLKLQTLLNEIVLSRFKELKDLKGEWRGNYPFYEFFGGKNEELLCSFDLLSGKIKKVGRQQVPIPSAVFNNPLYSRIIKKKEIMAFLSQNGKTYEFEEPVGTRYRITVSGGIIIQKEMTLNGLTGWYEYVPDNTAPIPPQFKGFGNSTWASVGSEKEVQKFFIINEASQNPLCSYESTGIVSEVNTLGAPTGFVLMNLNAKENQSILEAYEPLIHFEDKQFVEIYQSTTTKEMPYEIKIRLPRYNLEFKQTIHADGTRGDLVWTQDPRYKVDLMPEQEWIPNFNTLLTLRAIKKEEVPLLALVPNQQFLPMNKADSEYYEFRLDTTGSIKKRLLDTPGSGGSDLTRSQIDSPQFTQWSGSESFSTYEISSNGALQTIDKTNQLYLAYLYLGRRQPLLAFNLLKESLKNAEPLTEIQIEWLRRIMLEIPIRIHDPEGYKISEDAQLKDPEIGAVRALVGSILAKEKLSGQAISIDYPTRRRDATSMTVNQEFQRTVKFKLRSFWTYDFERELSSVYDAYRVVMKKTPSALRLNAQQEYHVVNFLSNQRASSKKAVPSHIEYRQESIKLKRHMREKHRLERLEQSEKLSPLLRERLIKLRERILTQPKIKLSTQSIKESTVDVKPFYYFDSVISAMGYGKVQIFRGSSPHLKVSAEEFNERTPDDNFLASFYDFYAIAKDPAKKKQRDALLSKFENILPTLRNIDKNDNGDPVENMKVVLAYILRWPEVFPDASTFLFSTANPIIAQLNKEGKILKAKMDTMTTETLKTVEVKLSGLNTKLVEEKAIPLRKMELLPVGVLIAKEKKAISEAYKVYQEKIKADTESKKKEAPLIPVKKGMEEVQQKLYEDVNDEYTLGLSNNAILNQRNKLSKDFFESISQDRGKAFKERVDAAKKKRENELKVLTEQILLLANRPPHDKKEYANWVLKREALLSRDVTFEELQLLFLMNQEALYQQKTALAAGEIQELHNLMFQYLQLGTDAQYYERISTELAKLSPPAGMPKINLEVETAAIQQIGMLLTMERSYDPTLHPEILLFEYLDNKIINPEQIKYIEELLKPEKFGFKNQAIQLIMGGGKSKILLPLLALKKATGTNLSIIEVPDALFQINKADLDTTTNKLFGKRAHPFYFDSRVNCTVHYLRNLKNELRDIILNQEYLVTTRESMQSLELKYLKLLRFSDVTDKKTGEETAETIKLLADILKIFKYQGDAIIDEVDSTLDSKKELIYPIGTPTATSKYEIEKICDLFKFLETQKIELDSVPNTANLTDIVQGARVLTNQQWDTYFKNLAHKLVYEQSSPLKDIFSRLLSANLKLDKPTKEKHLELFKKMLKDYFLGVSDIKPIISVFPNLLTDENLDILAIYKEELKSLLPLTLKRKMDEHYGLSMDPNRDELEREIAIPYLASNTPSERSQFGNYLTTINYTILIQRNKSLSEAMVKRFVGRFKQQQEEERKLYHAHIKDRKGIQSVSDKFLALTGQNLDELDLNDTGFFKKFYDAVKNTEEVKRYCLEHHILPAIEKNPNYLASNAQNHCSQYRSVQGMTGTDYNHHTYPDNMVSNKAVRGSDGQVIDYLLRDQQPIHRFDSASTASLATSKMALDLLRQHASKEKLHAWIDLGAHFKGVSNRAVANQFADLFRNVKEFGGLRYVLYFGSDDRLYALRIPRKEEEKMLEVEKLSSILLESSDADYIAHRLNCTPDQCFTYYDQRRTIGTDIKQALDAHAILTVGANTLEKDLLQAAMRFRQLRDLQRMDIAISKELQDAHPEIRHWRVEDVVKICVDNQVEKLADEHFRSAIQKMNNKVRNQFLETILSITDVAQQQKSLKEIANIFFTEIDKPAFELYGRMLERDTPKKVLEAIKAEIITKWRNALSMIKIKVDNLKDEEARLNEALQAIIDRVVPICHATVTTPASERGSLDSIEAAVVVEEEQLSDINIAKELEPTRYPLVEKASAYALSTLGPVDFGLFRIREGRALDRSGINTSRLESMVREGGKLIENRNWSFSDNIFTSQDFRYTTPSEAGLINAYTKDNLFFLVEQDDILGTLKFLLVTAEEAGHLKEQLQNSRGQEGRHFWLESPHQTLLVGIKPAKLNPAYSDMLDQVALFNGDSDVLYNRLNSDSWLKDNPLEKLAYLERVSLPLHPDKVNLVDPLYERVRATLKVEEGAFLTQYRQREKLLQKIKRAEEKKEKFNKKQ